MEFQALIEQAKKNLFKRVDNIKQIDQIQKIKEAKKRLKQKLSQIHCMNDSVDAFYQSGLMTQAVQASMARCTSADPKKRLQQKYKVRKEDVRKVKAINQMEDSQLIEEIRPKTQQGPRNHRNRGYDSSAMQKTLVMHERNLTIKRVKRRKPVLEPALHPGSRLAASAAGNAEDEHPLRQAIEDEAGEPEGVLCPEPQPIKDQVAEPQLGQEHPLRRLQPHS